MSCTTNNSGVLPVGPAGPTGATGATGAAGAAGDNGTTVIYANISDVSTSSGSYEVLQSYTLPAATLVTNGDTIELVASLSVNDISYGAGVTLYIGNQSMVTIPPSNFSIPAGAKYCLFKAYVTKQSAVDAFIQYFVTYSADVTFTTVGSSALMKTGSPVTWASNNDIELYGSSFNGSSNTLTAHSLLIFKYSI